LLQELYLNDNQLKKLPETICNLSSLVVLNVANNSLKALPQNLGHLKKLKLLSLNANKHLKHLPKSICQAQRLTTLELDPDRFVYPPSEVVAQGAEAILRYVCNDVGVDYLGPDHFQDSVVEDVDDSADQIDAFEVIS
jgi:hypothetical protein